ncbi:MAG UNVERIFIED_CONTAM: dihydrodipicolinate synthase family protein, partial [Thermobifida fusca]
MFEAQLITALPTPFTADERLDTSGLATLTTWIRDSGVDGVFAAGTTGEFT